MRIEIPIKAFHAARQKRRKNSNGESLTAAIESNVQQEGEKDVEGISAGYQIHSVLDDPDVSVLPGHRPRIYLAFLEVGFLHEE